MVYGEGSSDSHSSQACIQDTPLLWYDSVQNSKRLSALAINPAFSRYLSASSRLAPNTAGAVAESLVITTDRCPNTVVTLSLEAIKKSTGAASIVDMFSCL